MQSVLGREPHHYRKLGLTEGVIEPWEDGLRTNAAEESFEWWYFDCHLDDGSKLAIEFHTKPPYLSPSKPLTPYVSFLLDRPDGSRVEKRLVATPEAFSARRDRCDVRIAGHTFAGDLARYRIHVDIEGVVADVTLSGDVPPWRPATGHVFFGDDEQHYVAWLPAVPRGTVQAAITIDGRRQELAGVGYHDHNWGNVALRKIIDHWYWGRARIGDYTVLTLNFVGHESYGRRVHPAFMVAKGGRILASAVDDIRFTAAEYSRNAETGTPVANRLVYELDDGGSRYAVTFRRRRDVLALDFGPAGAYVRFLGDVAIERCVGERVVETERGDAMWELLYFGTRERTT